MGISRLDCRAQAEVLAAKRMIGRTANNFTLQPSRLLDSAYGSADMPGRLVDERDIEPHVTVFDKSARKDGAFAREDFNCDPSWRRLCERRLRKKVEMLFVHLKRILQLDRLRLRGSSSQLPARTSGN
jgi:hypothetical protein